MLKPGINQRVRITRDRSRKAPFEYSDAVELWAREHGGHASLKWLPNPMNCWCITLSFKVGDPRQGGPEDGEKVLLHEWRPAEWWARHKPRQARRHYRTNRIMPGAYAYELDELGVEGIRRFLDKGNVLSGRGEFRSAQDAANQQQAKHERRRDKDRSDRREEAGARARDKRRTLFKIPFLPVGIDLQRSSD